MQNVISIKILFINEDENANLNNDLFKFVSQERLERVSKLKKNNDRLLSLYAACLAKKELATATNNNWKSLCFQREKNGKPVLKNMPNVFFSISHSCVAVAFVRGECEIGIDIEIIKNRRLQTLGNVLTKEEKFFVQKSRNEAEALMRVWTQKEAYVKMTGEGITDQFSKINVVDEKLSELFITFNYKGYVISVCSRKIRNSEIKIEEIEINDIKEYFLKS